MRVISPGEATVEIAYRGIPTNAPSMRWNSDILKNENLRLVRKGVHNATRIITSGPERINTTGCTRYASEWPGNGPN